MKVSTLKQMKAAIESGATEITSSSPEVVDKIRILMAIRKYGPAGVAAVAAAIPVFMATAPVSAPTVAALSFLGGGALGAGGAGSAVAASAIVALVVVFGGVVVVSLLTDWDYVEINGLVKMSKKQKD